MHLWTARSTGTVVVALLAWLAVDLPVAPIAGIIAGNRLAALVGAGVLSLALGVAAADFAGSRQARMLASLTHALVAGAFMLTVATNPIASSLVVAWALYGLGRILFDEVDWRSRARRGPADPSIDDWLAEYGPAIRHLLGISIVANVIAVGYGFERSGTALAICTFVAVLSIGSAARLLMAQLGQHDLLAGLVVALGVSGVLMLATPRLSLTLLGLAQLLLLLSIARRVRLMRDLIDSLYERPAVLVTASFVGLILVGALLLSFPAASSSGRSVGLLDALFTATSAACVTGLIVLDTAADFSVFGQATILLLVQVGGINIMVLSTFAALLLGRGLGLRGEGALGDVLDVETPEAAYRLATFIVRVTLAVEAAGAAGLTFAYLNHGYGPGEAVWNGVFHAVSAFCNAGFALHRDSMIMFQHQPLPLLLVATLITAGGAGFAVMAVLWRWIRRSSDGHAGVQSRIVIVGSLTLIVIGTGAFLLGEWNASLADLAPMDKLVNALFQSVTLRTAGFNSVGFDEVRPVTVLWMLPFMFIGASPGGTGGGIKTTTAVVLFAAIPAFLRRRRQLVIGGRSISPQVVYQSASVAVASAVIVLAGATLLMASQTLPFEEILFEAVSAFGTVGLTLGATSGIDAFGKTVVILLMLIGRVGPLTVTLLLARDDRSRVRYPEARLMVG